MTAGLVRAWAGWEQFPRSRDAVVELQVELNAVAAEHGMTPTELLVRMTDARRAFAGGGVTNAELGRCVDVALGRRAAAA